jgi:uncharacterized protein
MSWQKKHLLIGSRAVYSIVLLPGALAVSRLSPELPIPEWASEGALVSVTRTPSELSIVCREDVVPRDVPSERGWRCLQVAGELKFSLVGVLIAILQPLAQAAVPVFVVSTFVTDYVLIKAGDLERAVKALEDAGLDLRFDTQV